MRVLLFGANGMVGQGVLRECLHDDTVTDVLVLGRSSAGVQHPKLTEVLRADLTDLSGLDDALAGRDACFFCLGVSSLGMKEEEYRTVTHDLTLAVARPLAERNPDSTFVYVSGEGTDSSEQGRSMWARVKGRTENELLALPFQAYMFRPGYIQPMHGTTSRTTLYRAAYVMVAPFYPLLRRLAPNHVTTTEQMGRAMLAVARSGAPSRILRTRDINAVANR